MQIHKELVIPFSELRTVSVECGDCHAVIVLDIEAQLDVTRCAACNRQFDDASVKNVLSRWLELYARMQQAKHKLAFRVAAPHGVY